MTDQIKIEFLADHRDLIPMIEAYFKTEWKAYYGPQGPGNALEDINSLCNKSILPIGLVALKKASLLGIVALREKTASHHHLHPWLTSLLVIPIIRHQGVGTKLIVAVEKLAIKLGYLKIYTRSATAVNFFKKNNWVPFDRTVFDKVHLTVFYKTCIYSAVTNGFENKTRSSPFPS